MNFVTAMQAEANWKKTENGADALKSSGASLLNLYSLIGAYRTRSDRDIVQLVESAYHENPTYTLKALFYARDIRGGLGERNVVRIAFRYLAKAHTDSMKKNLEFIPEFGRWDDLYSFVGTSLEADAFEVIRKQLLADWQKVTMCNNNVSICAKWMKSPNTSSAESRRLGRKTALALHMSEKNYRKMLSTLREAIDVVERKMAAQKWNEIIYENVPSGAMKNYRNAFERHDVKSFNKFIEKVEKGEATIKAETLYPYDILGKLKLSYSYGGWGRNNNFDCNYDKVYELQWQSLPNYVKGNHNVVVMADTSGSMTGSGASAPINTSIGLAIYFAERNSGPYHNTFMTFSSRPSFVTLQGDTLQSKVRSIPAIVQDTNIEAGLDLILKVAVDNHLPADEMPKSLVIISDMEFNCATVDNGRMTYYEAMMKKFAAAGYSIPNIVFWNVQARQDTFHATANKPGVQLVSGLSPAIFKSVMSNIGFTAYEAMMNTLNDKRYEKITA